MSSVALAVSLASSFTSLATTAKPLPASPARAASIVALRANKLVCSAIEDQRTPASQPADVPVRVKAQKATRSLDRMDGAKDAAQRRLRRGILFQRYQVAVESIEILVALDEKIPDDVLKVVHALLPIASPTMASFGLPPKGGIES
jgi:hypothetical protein